MADGRLRLNVRIGATHIQSRARFPFVGLYSNPVHRLGDGLDAKTKLRIGEFRSKPGWRSVAVYRFFGMV